MSDAPDIRTITITMQVQGEQILFVLLAADGSINRMGNGVDNAERAMFVGLSDPGLFQGVRARITPAVLAWCGHALADPQPKGRLCVLTVDFTGADGARLEMAFKYGSASQGPPPDVVEFVIATVGATQPWFEEQKAMVAKSGA